MRVHDNMLTFIIAALVAAVTLTGTPATAVGAKAPKPARVQASADFVSFNPCLPVEQVLRYGRIEINAYDDDLDQTPVLLDTQYRQDDRISVKITYTDGTTWAPDPLAVVVYGDTAIFIIGYWGGDSLSVHDGGNPGTTVDWAMFEGQGQCHDTRYFLTGGNIKITGAL